jgi:hypothetical protein
MVKILIKTVYLPYKLEATVDTKFQMHSNLQEELISSNIKIYRFPTISEQERKSKGMMIPVSRNPGQFSNTQL